MNILLKSAIIKDSSGSYNDKKRDLLIRDGRIEKIAANIANVPARTREIRLKNLHVSKGWLDCSVSIGEPGYEDRESLENGLLMAACSGYTDVIMNPSNNPLPDTSGDIRFLLDKTSHLACQLHPLGTITRGGKGEELAELYDMHKHGACGFSDDQVYLDNTHLLKNALEYASMFKGCIVTFPIEHHLSGTGMINESEISAELGLKGIPALAEELAVIRDLRIQEYTAGKLHLSLISSEGSVKLIQEAKRKGRNVSAAVSVDHLYFTEQNLKGFNSNLKILPPLRAKKDRKSLKEAVLSGVIDMVTSDHRPLTTEEKDVEFNRSYYGSTGLESAFSILLELFGLDQAIEILTRGKERFGVPDPSIEPGSNARLSLFDPERVYVHSKKNQLGRASNSPYLGKELTGLPYGIVSKGQIVLRPERQ